MISGLIAQLLKAQNGDRSIESLLAAAESLGLSRAELEADARAVIEERMAFWLIGSVRSKQNYRERQRLAKRRLSSLLDADSIDSQEFEVLVARVASIQARIGIAAGQSRLSISTVDEATHVGLLTSQGERCSVCGVPLKQSARNPSDRFEDGREPLGESTLEHVTPFYLVGNETEVEFLCRLCNGMKNDRLGVHEDGLVVNGNTHRPRDAKHIRRRSIFWTCYQTRVCAVSECDLTTKASIMYASRIDSSVPLMMGNVLLRCEVHAGAQDLWVHALRSV